MLPTSSKSGDISYANTKGTKINFCEASVKPALISPAGLRSLSGMVKAGIRGDPADGDLSLTYSLDYPKG